MRTRIVKALRLVGGERVLAGAAFVSSRIIFRICSAHSRNRFSLSGRRVLSRPIAAAGSAQQFVGGHDDRFRLLAILAAPQDQADQAQLAGQGDDLGLGRSDQQGNRLAGGNRPHVRGLGVRGLGARDVVDGKYADVLQDGLAEGFADSQGRDPRE